MSVKKSHHYRFFTDSGSISGDVFCSYDKELVNQVKNVFRLKPGDQIMVLDDSGFLYVVALNQIESKSIIGEIKQRKYSKEHERKMRLFCSLLKGENLDLVLQKCTEIGVDEFYFIEYTNSVVKNAQIKDRWKRIVREASEQSMRLRMPKIYAPIKLDVALSLVDCENSFVAYEDSSKNIIDFQGVIKEHKDVNIFVGPEGGFSGEELSKMRHCGLMFFSIGDTVLRSETACIVSTGIFEQFMLK